MPSVLFCCCKNLLVFLSPDFKTVRETVCVPACVYVCGCVSVLFFQSVTCLDVFFVFPLRIKSEVFSPFFAKRL